MSFRISLLFICTISVCTFNLGAQDVIVDFAQVIDPPLVKKFSQYNAGIINPHSNYDRDIDKITEVNSHSFRIDLSIGKSGGTGGNPQVVTGTPNLLYYNFSKLDVIVKKMNDRNVLPMYAWCYIPIPLQESGDWRNLDTDIPNWKETWKEIHYNYAYHYKSTGLRIGYHEIYNEPDLFGVFLNEDDFENAWFDMYKYGVQGILEADSDAVVGGPAYAIGEWAGGFINFVSDENLRLDFFSFHSYMDGGLTGELNTVRGLLSGNSRYNTTDIFLNEFSWFNSGEGDNNASSPMNFHPAASRTLESLFMLLEHTDIEMVNWAQFMESTWGDDSYGLIRKDGHRKAAFNAFKIYADMPEERTELTLNKAGIKGMSSIDQHKACLVLWNFGSTDETLTAQLENIPFPQGNLKLYRIDKDHASYFDGAPENLEVVESQENIVTDNLNWTGQIPAKGVIYITIDDGSEIEIFNPDSYNYFLAKDIRTWRFYNKRGTSNYSFFDRKTWKAYLGMGSELYEPCYTAIEAENLPSSIHVSFQSSENVKYLMTNSLLALRIDFQTNSGYTKSVLFHDGIFNSERDWKIPWGTKQAADEVVEIQNLEDFDLSPGDYVPTGWNGRAIFSYQMEALGPNRRSIVTLRSNSPNQLSDQEFTTKSELKITDQDYNKIIEIKGLPEKKNLFIYDVKGRSVLIRKDTEQNSIKWNTSDVSNGIYIIKIQAPNIILTGKTAVIH